MIDPAAREVIAIMIAAGLVMGVITYIAMYRDDHYCEPTPKQKVCR